MGANGSDGLIATDSIDHARVPGSWFYPEPAGARQERIAPIWSSTRRPSFADAESRLATCERHVVGHYRLGEALESECANLFGCDASP